jgi:hypothetical protein
MIFPIFKVAAEMYYRCQHNFHEEYAYETVWVDSRGSDAGFARLGSQQEYLCATAQGYAGLAATTKEDRRRDR